MLNDDLSASYGLLPAQFFTRVAPTPVAAPRLIRFNHALAADIGLHVAGLDPAALAEIFSGNRILPGSQPLAMAYAGHQFGQFVPQLGDGRAILLGEVKDPSGRRRDIQLKGSGRTPYSRGGDGRAALGPVLREYLVSEAMHALGIPTTRALAAVTTGETVMREARLPGAILTRVAASHVRVGTFQFFAARGELEAIRHLADYVIERHYPAVAGAANPHLELLRSVVLAQAELVAGWMAVGFIHGVMNTDNTSVSGETIDFGPCAFMDDYDPETVFSSIDQRGRYAYANQPAAAQWNLARLAETLLPLLDPAEGKAVQLATDIVSGFGAVFEERRLHGMRRKLGLFTEDADDGALSRDLLTVLQQGHADYTLTFRRLSAAAEGRRDAAVVEDAAGAGGRDAAAEGRRNAAVVEDAIGAGARGTAADHALLELFEEPGAMRGWLQRWRLRTAREPQSGGARAAAMRCVNPAVIPRNHRIEQAIAAALEQDFGPFEKLAEALSRPYAEESSAGDYARPPRPDERVLQTFCGT